MKEYSVQVLKKISLYLVLTAFFLIIRVKRKAGVLWLRIKYKSYVYNFWAYISYVIVVVIQYFILSSITINYISSEETRAESHINQSFTINFFLLK